MTFQFLLTANNIIAINIINYLIKCYTLVSKVDYENDRNDPILKGKLKA